MSLARLGYKRIPLSFWITFLLSHFCSLRSLTSGKLDACHENIEAAYREDHVVRNRSLQLTANKELRSVNNNVNKLRGIFSSTFQIL